GQVLRRVVRAGEVERGVVTDLQGDGAGGERDRGLIADADASGRGGGAEDRRIGAGNDRSRRGVARGRAGELDAARRGVDRSRGRGAGAQLRVDFGSDASGVRQVRGQADRGAVDGEVCGDCREIGGGQGLAGRGDGARGGGGRERQ